MATTTMLCASCATVEATAPRRKPKPSDEAQADTSGGVVALEYRDLREVALGVGDDLRRPVRSASVRGDP